MALVQTYGGLVRVISGVVPLGCCCEETIDCNFCSDSPLPASITVIASGFTGSLSVYNGTHTLVSDGFSDCIWVLTYVSGSTTVVVSASVNGTDFSVNFSVPAGGVSSTNWATPHTSGTICRGTHVLTYNFGANNPGTSMTMTI